MVAAPENKSGSAAEDLRGASASRPPSARTRRGAKPAKTPCAAQCPRTARSHFSQFAADDSAEEADALLTAGPSMVVLPGAMKPR